MLHCICNGVVVSIKSNAYVMLYIGVTVSIPQEKG